MFQYNRIDFVHVSTNTLPLYLFAVIVIESAESIHITVTHPLRIDCCLVHRNSIIAGGPAAEKMKK